MTSQIRRNSTAPYMGDLVQEPEVALPEVSLPEPEVDEEEDSFSAISTTDLPTPPDGGWGWAVVFASFMIHVVGKQNICLHVQDILQVLFVLVNHLWLSYNA